MNELLDLIYAVLGDNPDWKQVLLISLTPVFVIAFANPRSIAPSG